MTRSISTKTQTTDSTDRMVSLSPAKAAPVQQSKTPTARFSGTARRLLNALMRSLASPHI